MLCQICDGKCPICDSLVKPTTRVRVCEECSFGHLAHRCILCGVKLGENNEHGSPAYYCLECVRMDKDREGCPRIVNIGSSKTEMIYNKKKANSENRLMK